MTARMVIALDDWQISEISDIARKQHASKTQVVRDAICMFLQKKKQNTDASHSLLKFAGILKNKKIDGLTYQREIRAEWDKK